ncbi:transposable element-derived protein [Colletotrichum tabaci]|uniref:Transposable element-derived protein n=1 Tax=Colletotrichum tabaci TaxID=1209068 RepID=A0AAV9SSV2_9PEZI
MSTNGRHISKKPGAPSIRPSGCDLTVDEAMVRFTGREKSTIPTKPIPTRFKGSYGLVPQARPAHATREGDSTAREARLTPTQLVVTTLS